MYLTRLEVEGLRHAEHRVVEPAGARAVPLGPPPEACAVADAIDLLAAALDQRRLSATAHRLGWGLPGTRVVGDAGDAELHGLHAPTVEATLAPGLRSLTVDATLGLDPPLFGRLREQAARDPRMVVALGTDPQVRVKVGWLTTRDRSGAHPSVLVFRIGDVGFDTVGKERPPWLPELYADLGARFHRVDLGGTGPELAESWLAAWLSPEPSVRTGVDRARSAVTAPPFGLPPPACVRAGSRLEVVFGDALIRARQLGRPALDAVRLAHAAFVVRPDVLVADEALPPDVIAWLGGLPERDDAPVEQVWTS